MKDILKDILVENSTKKLKNLHTRQTALVERLAKIQALIGPRRVGKTSVLLLAMESLRKQGIAANKILYFNFEDERVQLKQHELDLLLQAWRELHPATDLADCYFFFDEVQAVEGWEKFLNRINESISSSIVFTGSNSAVLHTNIKSVMRGRSVAVELLPLSFSEYCVFGNISPEFYGPEHSKSIAAFYQWLQQGGYPETVGLPSILQTGYLQEYYNAMLLRDIVEYNKVSNYSYLRSLYRHAATTVGKAVSVQRLYNTLKNQQYSVGKNSVYEAMNIAENAYLFKRTSRFDYSALKRDNSDKKIYWIDNGLLNAQTMQFTGQKGLLLENAVFWELYRRFGTVYNNNIYYAAQAGWECDFIVFVEGGTPLPVQVCLTLNDINTRQREINGVVKACRQYNLIEGWIITAEEESSIQEQGISIHVKAAWKWMLEKES
ncbi:ATP-binding protein [soil metagenome]